MTYFQGVEATAGAADHRQNCGNSDASGCCDQSCWPLLSWRRRNGRGILQHGILQVMTCIILQVVSTMQILEGVFSGSYSKKDGTIPAPSADLQALHCAALSSWSLLLTLLTSGDVFRLATTQVCIIDSWDLWKAFFLGKIAWFDDVHGCKFIEPLNDKRRQDKLYFGKSAHNVQKIQAFTLAWNPGLLSEGLAPLHRRWPSNHCWWKSRSSPRVCLRLWLTVWAQRPQWTHCCGKIGQLLIVHWASLFCLRWDSWQQTPTSPGARRTGRSRGAASGTCWGGWRRESRPARRSSSAGRCSGWTPGSPCSSTSGSARSSDPGLISTSPPTICSGRSLSLETPCLSLMQAPMTSQARRSETLPTKWPKKIAPSSGVKTGTKGRL